MSFTVTKSSQIRGWKNQVTHPRHATWKIVLSQIIFLENVSQIAWVTDTFFDHLGPFWAHLDPFGPLRSKMNFSPKMDKVGFGEGAPEILAFDPSPIQTSEDKRF